MKIIGADATTAWIEWHDDGTLIVVPPEEHERIEAILAKPLRVQQPNEEREQGRIDEDFVTLEPGTPEHVARSILALPAGFLLEGDDAIPAEEDADVPDAI
jgi:hypothetical protein